MGLTWKELPMKIQERLEESLLKKIKSMNEVSLSCFMKGSVGMGYEWNKRDKVKEMIFSLLEDFYNGKNKIKHPGRLFAAIVYNMGELGMKWEDISEQLGEGIFSGIEACSYSFNSQQISNLVYG
jgi:hypothetical protein